MNPDQMPTDEHARQEERDATELKLKVNNLVWMHAPIQVTLGEAESRACRIMDILTALAGG